MITIFLGPTLSTDTAASILPADYRAPAAQGDVYRAALQRPAVIGLVDGVFDSEPAVWHKEILWAISEGIRVYGSSSMGALRAAELHSFGMTGIGRIFEQYRDGSIEDDDEVALLHAPAEFNYRSLTEPMVNIRATIQSAIANGILSEEVGTTAIAVSKDIHYTKRTSREIVARLRSHISSDCLEMLEQALTKHPYDQKAEDAMAMLAVIRDDQELTCSSSKVKFAFQRTSLWDEFVRSTHRGASKTSAEIVESDEILATLRQMGDVEGILMQARFWILANEEARRHGYRTDGDRLAQAVISFREQKQLIDAVQMQTWLRENALSMNEFVILAAKLDAVKYTERLLHPELMPTLLDVLRCLGRYEAFFSQKGISSNGHSP